jgi:uncharacterized membrane protein
MSPTRYRKLDAAHILNTIVSLKERIDSRFPGSGLGKVCGELKEVGEAAAAVTESFRRPIYPIRALSWLLIGLIVLLGLAPFAVLFSAEVWMDAPGAFGGLGGMMEAIEATLNELVLLGVAVIFLATAEGRIKRHRSLRALRELRSIAHVVDMHQLTKDPKDLLSDSAGPAGVATDDPDSMSRGELAQYLDYCSEVLSLTSKLAALYLEGFDDHVVIGAVNEIENLASGLSGKIWQKIMILDRVAED